MASKPERQTVKVELLRLGDDEPRTFLQLEALKDDNTYHDYTVGMYDIAGCGCYYPCSCNPMRLIVHGIRWETDEEMDARIQTEKQKRQAEAKKREERDINMLKDLMKRYPDVKP